ncbi:hypothetical protein A2304_02810 [Candidatus Uhrbacteria bacterium RIFOXYB2_FULL_57_15]|uniref:Uncharacterized protein n=1 Tax=Candidatus Uhrbacteria bacterium RIFOXYB2_FULL_57_15 TaxID=1802422 RepID=A0A1F7W8D2_9BACT|nr:MAG: hypothetical protein A2304_02810 [Candidatus Uhrbacteria bacterium RIFOXYB2_FULL_57_15]OGM00273.1 MAG: hypothetical protein A2501_01940 [Candidatus Uhrbacteria bacterium RIFOXYC12_FULL_57_11]
MSDIFSKEKRSEVMSRIRSKNTKVERIVFSFLRKEKIHFQRHYARVVGCPDVARPYARGACLVAQNEKRYRGQEARGGDQKKNQSRKGKDDASRLTFSSCVPWLGMSMRRHRGIILFV